MLDSIVGKSDMATRASECESLKAYAHFCDKAAVLSLTIEQGRRACRWRRCRSRTLWGMMLGVGLGDGSGNKDSHHCALADRSRDRIQRIHAGERKSAVRSRLERVQCLCRLPPARLERAWAVSFTNFAVGLLQRCAKVLDVPTLAVNCVVTRKYQRRHSLKSMEWLVIYAIIFLCSYLQLLAFLCMSSSNFSRAVFFHHSFLSCNCSHII